MQQKIGDTKKHTNSIEHIYIYIYLFIYVFTYIYIYIFICRAKRRQLELNTKEQHRQPTVESACCGNLQILEETAAEEKQKKFECRETVY